MHTFNATTTVNLTNDAKVIKMEPLENVQEFQLKEKTVCMQVFGRA